MEITTSTYTVETGGSTDASITVTSTQQPAATTQPTMMIIIVLMVASPVVSGIPVSVIIMLGSWSERTERFVHNLFKQFNDE